MDYGRHGLHVSHAITKLSAGRNLCQIAIATNGLQIDVFAVKND